MSLLRRKADVPLEVAILWIAALGMVVAGVALLLALQGRVPFYEDGLYGLVLVLLALQMITLGKTPFGDLPRPRLLLIAGSLISSLGILSCIIPGLLGSLPRALVVVCLGPGSLALLLQLVLDPGKLQTWTRLGGSLAPLGPSCAAVYLMSIAVAILIGLRDSLIAPVVLLGYGLAILILALVLYRVYAGGLVEEKSGELSTDHALMLLTGLFMVILGVMLIPVNLGWLTFSASAQLGLLMVIFAMQMLSSGTTPLGPVTRSWPVVALGLVFAGTGFVSCLVPELLTSKLTILIGCLNLLGGALGLLFRQPAPRPIAASQLTMNLLNIVFGASMLISNLLPGLVIGAVLALNGCVLLYLLRALVALARARGRAGSDE